MTSDKGNTVEVHPLTESEVEDSVLRKEDNNESIGCSDHEDKAKPNKRRRTVQFKLFGANIVGETEDNYEAPPPAAAAKPIPTETGDYNLLDDGYTTTKVSNFTTITTQSPPPFIEYLPSKPRPYPGSIYYYPGTSSWPEFYAHESNFPHSGFNSLLLPPPTFINLDPVQPKPVAYEEAGIDIRKLSSRCITSKDLRAGRQENKSVAYEEARIVDISKLSSRCISSKQVRAAARQVQHVYEDSGSCGYESGSGSN